MNILRFLEKQKKVYIKKEQVENLIYKKFGGGGESFLCFPTSKNILKEIMETGKKFQLKNKNKQKSMKKIFCLDKNYSEFLK